MVLVVWPRGARERSRDDRPQRSETCHTLVRMPRWSRSSITAPIEPKSR